MESLLFFSARLSRRTGTVRGFVCRFISVYSRPSALGKLFVVFMEQYPAKAPRKSYPSAGLIRTTRCDGYAMGRSILLIDSSPRMRVCPLPRGFASGRQVGQVVLTFPTIGGRGGGSHNRRPEIGGGDHVCHRSLMVTSDRVKWRDQPRVDRG